MGRQTHIVTSALGRSPFGEPLRDGDGNFILGPHAHDNDGPGYVQQFSERGHPQNRASKAAARRLRKAQNDVLATVGVVVKKGEERKTSWDRLEDNQKYGIIYDENVIGSQTKGEDRVAGVVLPWTIVSLRRRIMAFSDYCTVPLSHLLVKEKSLLGTIPVLFGGLPLYLLSTGPQMIRHYICDPNIDGLVNFTNPWHEDDWDATIPNFIKWHSVTILMRLIELPLLTHATLQSLHIIPANVGLTWLSFFPFSAFSPVSIPPLPSTITRQTFMTFALGLARSPLYVYLVRDYLHTELGYRLYALFRQLLTKPDRPDPISAKVSDEAETIDDTSIAGIGSPWQIHDLEYERNKRNFGPRSFFGAFRVAFPPAYGLFNFLSGGRLAHSRGRLTPLLDRQLRAAARERYWEDRLSLDERPARGSTQDLTFRQLVVNHVFRAANLSPVEELVDPIAWTNDTLGPNADALRSQLPSFQRWSNSGARHSRIAQLRQEAAATSHQSQMVGDYIAEALRVMPSSDAVVIEASDAEVVMYTHDQSDTASRPSWQPENIHRIDAANVPFADLIQAVNNAIPHAEQIHPIEPRSWLTDESHSDPPTPTPGITRAVSLSDTQPQDQPQAPTPAFPAPRRLRAPTETDDTIARMSETLLAGAENLQSSSLPPSPVIERRPPPFRRPRTPESIFPDPPLMPQKLRQYRVTMLSNHPADSLAWHSSALLTSLILWPVEAMWLRSVANWALQNEAMGRFVDPWWAARLGLGVIGQAGPVSVLGLGTWFGDAVDRGGRLKYVGSVLLTLGLEGLMRGACWSVGVWFVKRIRERFGWGQF